MIKICMYVMHIYIHTYIHFIPTVYYYILGGEGKGITELEDIIQIFLDWGLDS